MSTPRLILVLGFAVLLSSVHGGDAAFDYGDALTKSLLYFEAQRSGKLPPEQRVQWRGNSGLTDGKDAGIDLTGGYYDAGDNVKFGLPMAFTITTLAWSVVEYGSRLEEKKELSNALAAIKWGTDYFIKAHAADDVLYVEVGDGNSDHGCWMRPEDMTTSRTSYKIDASHPGADVAGETAAALAAASIAFKRSDPGYSATLIHHAKQIFQFACDHPGLYQNSVPVVQGFYSSSHYKDELIWAAAWLYRATDEQTYLDFLASADPGETRIMFSWDDKFTGAEALVVQNILEGKVNGTGIWQQYESHLDEFICNVMQKGSSNTKMNPAGMLYWLQWNNLQYTTSAMLLLTTHADHLSAAKANIECPLGIVSPQDIIAFAKIQVDSILGDNPQKMSYMVGFGDKYPLKVHHRGASIISIRKDPTPVYCGDGYANWYNRDAPNPNVIDGAIVGGPDLNDAYTDSRSNYQEGEAATANTAPFVGVLARFA